jgi:hypothetical protein
MSSDEEVPKRREWTPSEIRAWQDRLPPFDPGPAVPFDYSALAAAFDPEAGWAQEMGRVDVQGRSSPAEVGRRQKEAARRAEELRAMRDRMRGKG